MLTTETLDSINSSLLLKFGRIFDKQKYRLVWSTHQFEQRYVEGYEFIKGTNIKLRDVKGIVEKPKYPRDKDRYVLEILVPIPEALKGELVGMNGLTYEPLYIFNNKGYQEPNWNVINVLAYFSHYPIEQVMMSECEIWKMDKKEFEACMDILNDGMPDLAVKMKQGSATFMDSTKRFHLIN